MLILRSAALVVVAAFFEIGGAWLVWQGVREHRGWLWIGGGGLAPRGFRFLGPLPPRGPLPPHTAAASWPSVSTASAPPSSPTPPSAASWRPTAGSSSPVHWPGARSRTVIA